MDLISLSNLVIEKLRESGFYSELSDEDLQNCIHEYLDNIYRKYMYIAQKKISDDEKKGVFPNHQEYKKQYDMVEDIVMVYANKLAATNRNEF